ncbi:hypothetical protein HGRIS_003376 [Hohenbuehelia grisea]|uniref:Uncharacterized protein n=1 Tax=Hohenbuehelia grisea TaxID=104357 RepID=A0ABR3JG52_9AGAR
MGMGMLVPFWLPLGDENLAAIPSHISLSTDLPARLRHPTIPSGRRPRVPLVVFASLPPQHPILHGPAIETILLPLYSVDTRAHVSFGRHWLADGGTTRRLFRHSVPPPVEPCRAPLLPTAGSVSTPSEGTPRSQPRHSLGEGDQTSPASAVSGISGVTNSTLFGRDGNPLRRGLPLVSKAAQRSALFSTSPDGQGGQGGDPRQPQDPLSDGEGVPERSSPQSRELIVLGHLQHALEKLGHTVEAIETLQRDHIGAMKDRFKEHAKATNEQIGQMGAETEKHITQMGKVVTQAVTEAVSKAIKDPTHLNDSNGSLSPPPSQFLPGIQDKAY